MCGLPLYSLERIGCGRRGKTVIFCCRPICSVLSFIPTGTVLREHVFKETGDVGESELGRAGLRGARVKVPGHLSLAGTLRVDTVF